MDAIKEKLKCAFADGLDTEMQVVYVLVEIRKYLEQNAEFRKRHPALNFYCCWAVHSEAAGHGADRILERFDRLYPLMKSGLSAKQREEIFRTLTLGKLKEELLDFSTPWASRLRSRALRPTGSSSSRPTLRSQKTALSSYRAIPP